MIMNTEELIEAQIEALRVCRDLEEWNRLERIALSLAGAAKRRRLELAQDDAGVVSMMEM